MPATSRLSRADGTALRALVVDDEVSLCELLQLALQYEGWEVETATEGAQAVLAASRFAPDLIVLDIMLPDLDGLDVLRQVRAGGVDAPVLFLTAKDSLDDRVAGLTAGGDDYVTKPFSLEEVVARTRCLVRRTPGLVREAANLELRVGDLVLNEETYEVTRAGHRIVLTSTEFELLRFLMRNPRRTLTRAQILAQVWNYDFGGRTSIVELYISYLRKKLDAVGAPMIQTVRGVGYLLQPARAS